jgi:hypothetical protein
MNQGKALILRQHVVDALEKRLPIYVSERDAAVVIGRGLQTLRNWRSQGRPPRYTKIGGRSIAYRLTDLIEFAEGHAVEPRQV